MPTVLPRIGSQREPIREDGIIGPNHHDLILKPDPYCDTRPRIADFTAHDLYFKETRRPLPLPSASYQIGLRPREKPTATAWENAKWDTHFQFHEHTFDMLRDSHAADAARLKPEEEKRGQSPAKQLDLDGKQARSPRNRVDPHRERKCWMELEGNSYEPFAGKICKNAQLTRGFRHSPRVTFGHLHQPFGQDLKPTGQDPTHGHTPRPHPDSCRWMVGLRGGPREGEKYKDALAIKQLLEEEKETKARV